ncbi:MAG: type 1 periplasmic binding fold superfamily protein [Flavobacteriales bacterium]|nr:type 1 periplasmic binding fold superfamily protein [Flavobacteriales bacterium]
MMKIKFNTLLMLILSAFMFTACESDDDDNPDQNNQEDPEVITDLVLNFENPDTQETFSVSFSDPDGPGGNPPVVDEINLDETTAYLVNVTVADASDPDDVEDITAEIEEEDDEHQFFYVLEAGASDVLGVNYDPTDVDGDGNPIGLKTQWTTSGTTSGSETVTVLLRHEPNKNAPGAVDGELSEEVGGETDIQVTFNLNIE